MNGLAKRTPGNAAGIHRKYLVKRLADPTGKHRRCDYFVLDWTHDRFAIAAARAYADACEAEHPTLAMELRARASREAARWATRDPKPANVFHAHLDRCERCRRRPFDLCPAGAAALREMTVGPEAVTRG